MSNTKNVKLLHMPAISYRYRVMFPEMPDSNLTMQVVSTNLDLVNNRITLQFRQPNPNAGFLESMIALCANRNFLIDVEHVSGDTGESMSSFKLRGCKTEKHSYKLDYAVITPSTHDLEISFVSITCNE